MDITDKEFSDRLSKRLHTIGIKHSEQKEILKSVSETISEDAHITAMVENTRMDRPRYRRVPPSIHV